MEDYQELRSNLISMLEELSGRLARITDDVKHADQPVEKDFEERAAQAENDEVLDQLGNAARTEVEEIRQAIARIDKGEYGTCMMCGEPIPKERLHALPYTGMCVKCASSAGC